MVPVRSSSCSVSEKSQCGEGEKGSLVYLNVYDLTPANKYLYYFGFGVFHTGIEVHGMEYGFGAHDSSSSGVFKVKPKRCPGYTFRKSILLGSTDMSRSEFKSLIEQFASRYYGDTYNLIAKNCNHFTDEVSMHLVGRPIPLWVNRLARVGSFCACFLSDDNIKVETVESPGDEASNSDDDSASDSSLSSATSESDDEMPDYQLLVGENCDVTIVEEKPNEA